MCATIIYLVRTAAAVFYDTVTRCKYSSLDSRSRGSIPGIPGTVHASTEQTTNQRYGGLSLARKNSL